MSTALDTTERCTTLDSLDSLDSAVKLSSSTVVDNSSTAVDTCRHLSTVSTVSTARAQFNTKPSQRRGVSVLTLLIPTRWEPGFRTRRTRRGGPASRDAEPGFRNSKFEKKADSGFRFSPVCGTQTPGGAAAPRRGARAPQKRTEVPFCLRGGILCAPRLTTLLAVPPRSL